MADRLPLQLLGRLPPTLASLLATPVAEVNAGIASAGGQKADKKAGGGGIFRKFGKMLSRLTGGGKKDAGGAGAATADKALSPRAPQRKLGDLLTPVLTDSQAWWLLHK